MDGDTLSYALASSEDGVSTYGKLTVNANGTYEYVATAAAIDALKAGQTIADTFTVQVNDGQGGITLSTVTVNITGVNDAPIVQKDPYVLPTIGEDAGSVGPISLADLRSANSS